LPSWTRTWMSTVICTRRKTVFWTLSLCASCSSGASLCLKRSSASPSTRCSPSTKKYQKRL
jgi:hypothetical protein